MLNIVDYTPAPPHAACDSLIALSEELWTRQRYLANYRGRNNLELDMTPAELMEDVAKRVDTAIAEMLLAMEHAPQTPNLRRALMRLCHVSFS